MSTTWGSICRCFSFKLLSPVFALLAGLIPVSSAYAGGFRVYDQSVTGTAQGNAFTAQADDPSAIYYNPAGMTQLHGLQQSIGITFVGGHFDYRSPTGQTSRGDYGNSVAYPPPLNGYITANLRDLGFNALGDLTVGVGAIGAFGNMTQWPNNGPLSTAITSAALQMVDVKPTLAYKLNDQLSVGLGMDIYTFFNFWGEGQAENKFNSAGTPGLPPAESLNCLHFRKNGCPAQLRSTNAVRTHALTAVVIPYFRTSQRRARQISRLRRIHRPQPHQPRLANVQWPMFPPHVIAKRSLHRVRPCAPMAFHDDESVQYATR